MRRCHLIAAILLTASSARAQEMTEADSVAYLKKRGASVLPVWGKDVDRLSFWGSDSFGDADLKVIAGLPKLRVAHFTHCDKVGGAELAVLARLPSLEYLDFTNCPGMTDAGLKAISACKTVKGLVLGNCGNVTAAGIRELAAMPALKSLRFECANGQKSSALRALGALRQLKELEVWASNRTVELDYNALEGWSDMPLLETLKMRSEKATAKGLQAISGLPKLKQFKYSGNSVGDDDLDGLNGFKCLETIEIVGGGLTNAGMKKLATLRGIKELSIVTYDGVDNDGLLAFAAMKDLRKLTYQRSPLKITKEGEDALRKLRPELEVVEHFK